MLQYRRIVGVAVVIVAILLLRQQDPDSPKPFFKILTHFVPASVRTAAVATLAGVASCAAFGAGLFTLGPAVLAAAQPTLTGTFSHLSIFLFFYTAGAVFAEWWQYRFLTHGRYASSRVAGDGVWLLTIAVTAFPNGIVDVGALFAARHGLRDEGFLSAVGLGKAARVAFVTTLFWSFEAFKADIPASVEWVVKTTKALTLAAGSDYVTSAIWFLVFLIASHLVVDLHAADDDVIDVADHEE